MSGKSVGVESQLSTLASISGLYAQLVKSILDAHLVSHILAYMFTSITRSEAFYYYSTSKVAM